jgi:ketosteroid isomerase-like protein
MRTIRWTTLTLAALAIVSVAAVANDSTSYADLEQEVRATEAAFAKTMADRDVDAFARFLDEETVFFTHDATLRGRRAVVEAWSRFFQGESAPFSWEPEAVAVLDSGTLGLTSGPVFDPEGNRIGTFNSVWRRDDDGAWKIVFDRGCPDCP